MTSVKTPDGVDFQLSFEAGLPGFGSGPNVFLMKDGSIHCGELVRVKYALAPSGESQVVRTTNPAGGFHEVFDIPASRVIGYAFAGARYPFSNELASAY
jgi:hypothetical protein